MASLPGAIVNLMPCYSPWSEYEKGLSFEKWVAEKIFKPDGESKLKEIKSLLAEPEKMKQDDEMVVAFSARGGSGNPRLKPLSAINESAVGQLARFAIRRCWLAMPRTDTNNCDIFTLHASVIDGSLSGPLAWPVIIVVLLQEPLNDFPESSRDDPQRAEVSAVRAVFGCNEGRNVVERVCREKCDEMVADQELLEDQLFQGRGGHMTQHSVRWQYKVTFETPISRLRGGGLQNQSVFYGVDFF